MSNRVDGESHWFARIPLEGVQFDVDLTGDQFQRSRRERVQIAPSGLVWRDERVRSVDDVMSGTWERYRLLSERLEALP